MEVSDETESWSKNMINSLKTYREERFWGIVLVDVHELIEVQLFHTPSTLEDLVEV